MRDIDRLLAKAHLKHMQHIVRGRAWKGERGMSKLRQPRRGA